MTTETICAPSGFLFTIKPLTTIDFFQILNSDRTIDLKKLLTITIVDPKLTFEDETDKLSIYELSSEDVIFLENYIINQSGIKDNSNFLDQDLTELIATTCFLFKLRPADLLDPDRNLSELSRLFFDFKCAEIAGSLFSGKKSSKKIDALDKSKIEELKMRSKMYQEREVLYNHD